jgi:hypothetical protein
MLIFLSSYALCHTLGDDQPIERIFVVKGHFR